MNTSKYDPYTDSQYEPPPLISGGAGDVQNSVEESARVRRRGVLAWLGRGGWFIVSWGIALVASSFFFWSRIFAGQIIDPNAIALVVWLKVMAAISTPWLLMGALALVGLGNSRGPMTPGEAEWLMRRLDMTSKAPTRTRKRKK